MDINKLFNIISDEFKNHKNVKRVYLYNSNKKDNPSYVIIKINNNKEYWVNTDLRLIEKDLNDDYDDPGIKFEDIDFLCWEIYDWLDSNQYKEENNECS